MTSYPNSCVPSAFKHPGTAGSAVTGMGSKNSNSRGGGDEFTTTVHVLKENLNKLHALDNAVVEDAEDDVPLRYARIHDDLTEGLVKVKSGCADPPNPKVRVSNKSISVRGLVTVNFAELQPSMTTAPMDIDVPSMVAIPVVSHLAKSKDSPLG